MASVKLNTKYYRQYTQNVGEKLRRPALNATKIHSGTNSTRIAPPHTLTASYIVFCQKIPILAQFNDSDTQIHTIQNYITEVDPVLIH